MIKKYGYYYIAKKIKIGGIPLRFTFFQVPRSSVLVKAIEEPVGGIRGDWRGRVEDIAREEIGHDYLCKGFR